MSVFGIPVEFFWIVGGYFVASFVIRRVVAWIIDQPSKAQWEQVDKSKLRNFDADGWEDRR